MVLIISTFSFFFLDQYVRSLWRRQLLALLIYFLLISTLLIYFLSYLSSNRTFHSLSVFPFSFWLLEINLHIIDFQFFLFSTINFSLKTTLASSHTFWLAIYKLSLSSNILNFFLISSLTLGLSWIYYIICIHLWVF